MKYEQRLPPLLGPGEDISVSGMTRKHTDLPPSFIYNHTYLPGDDQKGVENEISNSEPIGDHEGTMKTMKNKRDMEDYDGTKK